MRDGMLVALDQAERHPIEGDRMKAKNISIELFHGSRTRQPFFMAVRGRATALLVLAALWMAWCPPVHAQSRDGADEPPTLSVLKFATGIITAYALHETGHALVAKATNTDLEWGVGTYNQPLGFTEHAKHKGDGMCLHAAGLFTQVVSSEVILQADSIDKNDNFVRGMMFWNIVNPIIYSLDYWWFKRANKKRGTYYQGDLMGVEHYSNETTANGYAAVMAGLAIYQGYRFLKVQKWAPSWIVNNTAQLNFQPAGSNGAALTIQVAFN
jgi:hypothetical protein